MKIQLIQVYILACNRPEYLMESLNSALKEDYDNFEVIVSDNSTNDDTEKRIKQIRHPKLRYIRRIPSTSSLEHYATILKEVSAEYFMLFHDDDLMEPGCLRVLSSTLEAFPTVAAVGGNARIFWDRGNVPSSTMFRQKSKYNFFESSDELAKRYLTFQGIAPFPSYMYRKQLIEGLELKSEEGGQTADVSFLLKILSRGQIIWINNIVMNYRKHPAQDSQEPNLKNMRSLLRFIYANTSISRNSYEVKYYKYKTWAGVLKSQFLKNGGKIENKRVRRVYLSIFRFSPLDIFLKLFVWRIKAIFSNSDSAG